MTEVEAGKAEGPTADDYALVAKAAVEVEAPDLPYRPPMPRDRSAPIALVGAGGISGAHLDAYARYGLNVVAICSRDLDRARARRDAHFMSARTTDDFDSLLDDPDIRVLDLTAHPDVRLDLMRRALSAGKHVLSQKPFVENLDDGRELAELAERSGLKLAVNQNGRWAPHLAYIREAVYAGLIGEITGVHVEIRWNHGWIAGTSFEAMDDLILWDFGVHWFDFLTSVIGDRARFVHATAARVAGQTARPPLLAQASIGFDGGQASLVFDGATRYGARDSTSVIGANGVAFRDPISAIRRSSSIPKRASLGRGLRVPGSMTALLARWANFYARLKTKGSR
jgi:predicted dehydrogenase